MKLVDEFLILVRLLVPSHFIMDSIARVRSMADRPYAIVVDGSGKVTEHMLGDHVAGTVLQASVKIVSNTVESGIRTVVLTRELAIEGLDQVGEPGNTNFH